jgi:anaerobic selenocysteine-containing dehydrogenase
MTVQVEEGRVRRIEPHPGNRATPEGACLKGLSYVERALSPDRLLHPLKRVEGTAEFEPVAWPKALDLIAAHLTRLKKAHGPQSVLYYTGSGTKGLLNSAGMHFFRLFGGCTTTYGDLCWPAGLEATRLTLGANKHSAPWDLAKARLIVLWGKNTAETNLHQMVFIEEAIEQGAKLVVIDPRRTQSAERADVLIQPRPGTDAALALAVAHLLIKNDWIDHGFIDSHVEGFEAFRERVQEFPHERAAEITGVPAGAILNLAQDLARIQPATICAGFGMQRYTNSGQTMRSMIALLALTGNMGKPGAGWQFANLQAHIFDPVKDPIAFYPPEKPDGVVRVSVSTARLGQDMLAQRDPPLKMIWVERGNPITQNPETHTVIEAFRELEFRVVVDQFMTDTAREADLILPAKTLFEQSDVINAYWHPYIQFKQKVMNPPGEVKPETEIYRLLAERLGIPEHALADKIPGPSDSEVEAFLEKKLAPFPELSLDQLREGPALPPGHQEVAFSDSIYPTPSGKIELYSQEAKERWGADPVPTFFEPEESEERNETGGGKYPLRFLTPNTKNRIHSQFNNLKMIGALDDTPLVWLSPEDAKARAVRNKDRVWIFNDRGRLTMEARIDFSLRKGCVWVTNGWWISEGGTVNFLSFGRETDMGHGAAFHDNLVEIEKVT